MFKLKIQLEMDSKKVVKRSQSAYGSVNGSSPKKENGSIITRS